ncbi:1-deoxy-D-xylulose 5-phosphate synthase [Clostridiaceae bacterium JG1575]|nr:1-deoxy-D-xylulose 5-phosphate synthase [Clostridiaceae bacterium JG1575]
MYELLKEYQGPSSIPEMSLDELNQLADEIRTFLIQSVSKTGGHLAPNLGVVELTLALHNVFDFSRDKLIFDVGHQSYVHKILTGRIGGFRTLRKYKGMAGFPKTEESPYDHFNTGHASTSVSAALGMARARDLKKEDHCVVALIGDGAFTGGMVWEALNDVGYRKTPLVLVLNDNEMSISRNVGGMSLYLSQLRSDQHYEKFKKGVQRNVEKLPLGKPLSDTMRKMKDTVKAMVVEEEGMIFENMGIKYLGPVDGHNIKELSTILKAAREFDGPVLVHAVTQKGRGYDFAVAHPDKFHGIAPFDCENGEVCFRSGKNYSKVFGETLCDLAAKDSSIVAITAAMPDGTGLSSFAKRHPDRFFDVGIAEEHAVTLAAGMAISGLRPFVAIYSTFLQRSLDQLIHDVALQNLPVTFCLDRAGIVGDDGETHQGAFDISYLSMIPGFTIMAPKNMEELSSMLRYAKNIQGPLAIRYPRGGDDEGLRLPALNDFTLGTWEALDPLDPEAPIILLGTGKMTSRMAQAALELRERGIRARAIHAPFIKPLDERMLKDLLKAQHIFTMEDGILSGGFGQAVEAFLGRNGYQGRITTWGYDDIFAAQGDVHLIYQEHGLTRDAAVEAICALYPGGIR